MTNITHHIEPALLRNYVDGNIDYATSLVVAAHISLCDTCRAEIELINVIEASALSSVQDETVDMALEDQIFIAAITAPTQRRPRAEAPYPQPVMEALDGKAPKWKPLGPGIKQHIIARDQESSVRLLYIEAGKLVPEHSHSGSELTLVLQGAFGDKTGVFHRGDVETADDSLEHQPIALPGEACICLASTSDRLIFKSFLPRLLQPLFQI